VKVGAIDYVVDNDFVKCSVFWNEAEALLILGNPESGEEQSVTFSVSPRALGWRRQDKVAIDEISGAPRIATNSDLRRMTESLRGQDFRVYRLRILR